MIQALKPLPIGMQAYHLTMVVDALVDDDDLRIKTTLGLDDSVARRQVKTEHSGGMSTVHLLFGAYDDEHARLSSSGAVQAAIALGPVNGVVLRQGARFIVAAHASLS